jgi:hypothetical protein
MANSNYTECQMGDKYWQYRKILGEADHIGSGFTMYASGLVYGDAIKCVGDQMVALGGDADTCVANAG